MTNEVTMQARAYSVTVEDQRSGEKSVELIALDKQQLQAAQIVGQSSNELIYRLFNRLQGPGHRQAGEKGDRG